MNWVVNNLANIIVLFILGMVVYFAIRSIVRSHKNGSCGKCGGCSGCSECSTYENKKNKSNNIS